MPTEKKSSGSGSQKPAKSIDEMSHAEHADAKAKAADADRERLKAESESE